MPAPAWYLRFGKKPEGPFTPGDLRRLAAEGRIGPDTKLRRLGDRKWTRASRIQGLLLESEPAAAGAPLQPAWEPGEYTDVDAILDNRQATIRSRRAAPPPVASEPLPYPADYHGHVVAFFAFAACCYVAASLAVVHLGRQLREVEAPPTTVETLREPTVDEAEAYARAAITARTDPASAEISSCSLMNGASSKGPAALSWRFAGYVSWTNRYGAPVAAEFGVIVRFEVAEQKYGIELLSLNGRVLQARIELGGAVQAADLDQLVRELFNPAPEGSR